MATGGADRELKIPALEIVRTIADLRDRVWQWRQSGFRIAIVPTMGALHDGHLSLVRAAVRGDGAADIDTRPVKVVATIFVNPAQFTPNEDFEAYPRTEARDSGLLAEAGADLIFMPDQSDIYPEGFSTKVLVSGVTNCLCGATRPHFFGGVATIVSKLFIQSGADDAYFGEKDYQQLQVVRRMAFDLDIPVRVHGVATVREADGLAMSSRNAYLTDEERALAPLMFQLFQDLSKRLRGGELADPLLGEAEARLLQAGFRSVDYLDLRDEKSFKPLQIAFPGARLFTAAWLGRARLIDNHPVEFGEVG